MELIIKNPFPFWEFETNEIDKLIKNLSEHCWNPQKAASTGLWHKYDLPYIGISDEKIILNKDSKYFDEYLGIYRAVDENWEKEGRIVLFKKSIEHVAETYSKESSIPKHECFINITKIVLLHEIGHWIFHYMPTKETSYNKLFKIFCNEFKEFNEAIAQYIVSIGIRGNIVLEQLFDWLCENQDQIYKNKLKDEINALSVLRNYIEKNCDSDKKESIPKTFDEYNNNFLNKMRGLIAGKTFGL